MQKNLMIKFNLAFFIVLSISIVLQASRLSEFADSIPVGTWSVFPTPTLTGGPTGFLRNGNGYSTDYGHQAVWDSSSQRLMFLGSSHAAVATGVRYDAATDTWSKILTPREPQAVDWRMGHTYDHLTANPDSGIAYLVTYVPSEDSGYFFRYHFNENRWDTLRARFQNGQAFWANRLYAGAMEFVPGWNSLVLLSGSNGNTGSILNLNVSNPVWENFGNVRGGTFHSILHYNSVVNKLICLSDALPPRLVNMDKTFRDLRLQPFPGGCYRTKVINDPTSGSFLAFATESEFGQSLNKLFAYEPGLDFWQEIITSGNTNLTGVYASSVIFSMPEHNIIGILAIVSGTPKVFLYKHTARHDTTMQGMETYLSKQQIEEWDDTTQIITVAIRNGGLRDTVTHSSFYASLDTLTAQVLPGGKVIPAPKTRRGTARILVIRNLGKFTWKDTIEVNVVANTAILDSVRLCRDSITMLEGDRFPLKLFSHYHRGIQHIARLMDTSDIWFSDNATVAVVQRAQIYAVASGLTTIRVNMGEKTDSVRVRVMNKPSFIKRINFKSRIEVDTTQVWGWHEDFRNVAYSSVRGHGFYPNQTGNSVGIAHSNFLLAMTISATSQNYKIDVPDGEYIIKIAMNNSSGGSWVYQGDTLFQIVGTAGYPNPTIWGSGIDTIAVSGGNGALFSVKGRTCYIIIMSNDGTHLDSVAWDQEPLVFVGDSAIKAVKADTSGSVTIEDNIVQSVSGSSGIQLLASPNPFNPSVTLNYNLHGITNAICVIYDIKGRIVRSFMLKKDRGRIEWDGCNYQGIELASGTYLARLKANAKAVNQKLILIR